MNFIITGGAGFIGSHLTEKLLSDGHQVIVVDSLATGRLDNLPNHPHLKIIQKDLSDCQPEDFPEPIDGVAHLAATPSVVDSWLQPVKSHHNNLSSMLNILLLCKALKISRVVFASSAAVYGDVNQPPISETGRLAPISPYGLQKLVSEQYATLFASHYDLSFIALRLFNVFGPRQLPSSPYSGVISIFTSAMQNSLPITIYGDGGQTRDFVFVQDVADAFSKALTVPLAVGSCLALNIGTGKGTSLLELIQILKSSFSLWTPEIHFLEVRMGDIQHSRADLSQAHSILSFKPRWSVKSGIHKMFQSLAKVESFY
jgi:UDP-glucose 4-epimerase